MRCALRISYNGTHFLGSQAQTETPNTILGNISRVLIQLGIHSKIIASGRTDKGVHAKGQICHLDLPDFWSDLTKLKRVTNEMLPKSIQINSIKKVSDTFHARYDAQKRTYRYIIKKGVSNPFEDDFVTFIKDVDFNLINQNIKQFIGEHDFKQLMKTGSDINSTKRVIYKAFTYKYKGYIILNFEANGFLRSQIRLMVGALLTLNTQEFIEQLQCRKNHKVKPAPSNGLYLTRIKY